MRALFTSAILVILTVAGTGCATDRLSRPPAVVQHASDAAQCSNCLVYVVHPYSASEVIVVFGSRDIPEGWQPSANDLLSMKTFRGNTQGVGPGVLIDISEMDRITVRSMHPAAHSIDFQNICHDLRQEFRDKRGRWHPLIEVFVKPLPD